MTVINHWYAVKTRQNPDCRWMGPSLVTIDEDTLYWSGGPSRMSLPKPENMEIVKDYGEVDEHTDAIDELYDQFQRDFPPVAELKVSGGWLAPDGNFYPCSYTAHLTEAQHLAFIHYEERGDGAQRLEEERWVKVAAGGQSYTKNYDHRYTKKQVETMMALAILAKEDERFSYAQNMLDDIKNMEPYR